MQARNGIAKRAGCRWEMELHEDKTARGGYRGKKRTMQVEGGSVKDAYRSRMNGVHIVRTAHHTAQHSVMHCPIFIHALPGFTQVVDRIVSKHILSFCLIGTRSIATQIVLHNASLLAVAPRRHV